MAWIGGDVNIDNDTLQENVDGSIYVPDIAPLVQENAEQQIEIIELQANSTITPLDHDTLISDTFSDSDGYLDSVNTGDTTALFQTAEKRYLGVGTGTVDAHGVSLSTSQTGLNSEQGAQITVNNDCVLQKITKDSGCTAPTAYLYDATSTYVLIDSAPFVGNDATFSASLSAGTTYAVVAGGGTYTGRRNNSPSYPYNGTNVNFTSASSGTGNAGTSYIINIVSVTTGSPSADELVAIDLPTISGTVLDVQLVANSDDDALTFDISDGSTDLTEQSPNEKISWTGSSNPTTLNLNLNTAGKWVKSYCLKLWKAL